MPYLTLISKGITSATFRIDGLGFTWDTAQYNYAYVTAGSQTSPADFPPPAPGSGTSTGLMTVSGLTGGTSYIATGYVVTAPPGNQLVQVGTYSFTTDMARPPNWFWYTPKGAHTDFSLDATEWNDFTARINQFRLYKGIGTYSFTTAPADASRAVYGWMYNQAVSAMSPMVTLPASTAGFKTTGDIIYAFYLQDFQNYLNSIS